MLTSTGDIEYIFLHSVLVTYSSITILCPLTATLFLTTIVLLRSVVSPILTDTHILNHTYIR